MTHLCLIALLVQGQGGAEERQFIQEMLALQKRHQLAPLARFESQHFVAIGNAADSFVKQRLKYCEIFYDLFYNHFLNKGFALTEPRQKLMVAVFDSPSGFDAYFGRKTPSNVTGIYHPLSNRLVIYDFGENRGLLKNKTKALAKVKGIAVTSERQSWANTVERQFDDLVKDINLTTTMHEAAHQLSFNGGLLNRHGDVPFWIAEGLACYCEATDQGDWQALGSVHPGRIGDLREPWRTKTLIPLQSLVRGDLDAFAKPGLAYAQSWALFHMLMHKRLPGLRRYVELIGPRRTPDHRLTDFLQAFGRDVAGLERDYETYVATLVEKTPVVKPR